MSISDAINNAKQKIANAYSALEAKGINVPADNRNLENLAPTVNEVQDFSQVGSLDGFRGSVDQGNFIIESYLKNNTDIVLPRTNGVYINYAYVNYNTSNGYVNYSNVAAPFCNNKTINSVDLNYTPFYSPSTFRGMQYAFMNCSNLTGVSNISNKVTNMALTFWACPKLKSNVEVPFGVTNLYNTFYYCNNLADVKVQSAIVDETNNCFYGTSLAKNVYIPFYYTNGINTSTYNSFYNNYSSGQNGVTLKDISKTNSSSVFDGWKAVETNEYTGFIKYEGSSKNVALPTGTNYYYNGRAFYNNKDIEEIDFAWATRVGYTTQLFFNCNNLKYVNNINGVLNRIIDMSSVFGGCTNFNQSVQIPNSATNMWYTFNNCTSFNQPITIPNSVINMGWTFTNCTSFNQPITIGSSVISMDSTFSNCRSLNQDIQIPSSVNCLSNTFLNCVNLTGNIRIYSNQIGGSISNYPGYGAYKCFYGTTLQKNVYIPFTYSNGANSATFNSFKDVGYLTAEGVPTGQHGVQVLDLNQYL